MLSKIGATVTCIGWDAKMTVPVPQFTETIRTEIQVLHSKGAGLLRLRWPFGMGTRVCNLNGES